MEKELSFDEAIEQAEAKKKRLEFEEEVAELGAEVDALVKEVKQLEIDRIVEDSIKNDEGFFPDEEKSDA